MNEAVRSGGLLGFYARYVLPRLIALAMRNKDGARLRSTWIPQAGGEVLEIGIGSGLKLNSRAVNQRVGGVLPHKLRLSLERETLALVHSNLQMG